MDSKNSTGLWGHYFEGTKFGSFHIDYNSYSLRRKIVSKDDRPNLHTLFVLEQVSIRKVLTSLEPWIPALCAHQNFMKQINDLSILTEVIDTK